MHAVSNVQKRDMYGFIVEHKQTHDGNSPSIRESADHCGIGSTNTVLLRLRKLQKDGLIELAGRGQSRMITIVGGTWLPPAQVHRTYVAAAGTD